MSISNLKTKISRALFCFMFLFLANAQEGKDKANRKLVELFNEWRSFEIPPLKEGVPDYSKNTFDVRYKEYKKLRNQLESFSIDLWPVHMQVDWYLLWAEMNGYLFNYKILKPWQRDPAFYKSIWTYKSDVPAHEGPTPHFTIELWQYNFPLNEKDRSLLYQENQSRSIAGLPDLTLSQAVDFLIKTTAETNAFQQPAGNSTSERDAESIMRTKETKDVAQPSKKSRKEKRTSKKIQEEEKLKEELFQMYEKHRTQQYGRNRGRGSYQRGRTNRPQPSGGQGGNGARHKSSYQPRKFTTPQMANVDPYNCLKCNSPDHRFTEVHKCMYGHTALMTKPCMNCKAGAHPTQMCIKSKSSTIRAPPTPTPQQAPPNTPVYTKWSDGRDANKRVEDTENFSQYSLFPQAKNEQRPSLPTVLDQKKEQG